MGVNWWGCAKDVILKEIVTVWLSFQDETRKCGVTDGGWGEWGF